MKRFIGLGIALLLALLVPQLAMAQQSLAERGRALLEQNQHAEGVVVTKSGLQYKILEPGNSNKPKRRSRVTVHYQGKHVDNEIFDGSFGGDPMTVRLDKVIKGWTEGLQLIGEGGRIVLYVPSKLAYGRDGAPPVIGRNETLVFIIDLIEVQR